MSVCFSSHAHALSYEFMWLGILIEGTRQPVQMLDKWAGTGSGWSGMPSSSGSHSHVWRLGENTGTRRVMCVPAVNGTLLTDANKTSNLGWGCHTRKPKNASDLQWIKLRLMLIPMCGTLNHKYVWQKQTQWLLQFTLYYSCTNK